MEIDHDWLAAGYCGPSTTCWNQTIVNSVKAQTTFDIQGFMFWDPDHVLSEWHNYSGWEIHPVTSIRIHGVFANNTSIGGGGGVRTREL
jgi:predicted outer membrane repeat protein